MNIRVPLWKLYLLLAVSCMACPVLSHPAGIRHAAFNTSFRSPEDSMQTSILFYINQYRKSKGLPVLEMNNVISASARMHSADMASRKTPFGHEGFDNRVKGIMKQLGPMHKWAENVAFGKLSAKDVVNGWLNSPPHKRNIEGGYTLTGIGTATSSEGAIYFTQIFTAR